MGVRILPPAGGKLMHAVFLNLVLWPLRGQKDQALELGMLNQHATLQDHGDKHKTDLVTLSPYFLPHKMGHKIVASKAL